LVVGILQRAKNCDLPWFFAYDDNNLAESPSTKRWN